MDSEYAKNHPHWYPLGAKGCYFCGLITEVDKLEAERLRVTLDYSLLRDDHKQLELQVQSANRNSSHWHSQTIALRSLWGTSIKVNTRLKIENEQLAKLRTEEVKLRGVLNRIEKYGDPYSVSVAHEVLNPPSPSLPVTKSPGDPE